MAPAVFFMASLTTSGDRHEKRSGDIGHDLGYDYQTQLKGADQTRRCLSITKAAPFLGTAEMALEMPSTSNF